MKLWQKCFFFSKAKDMTKVAKESIQSNFKAVPEVSEITQPILPIIPLLLIGTFIESFQWLAKNWVWKTAGPLPTLISQISNWSPGWFFLYFFKGKPRLCVCVCVSLYIIIIMTIIIPKCNPICAEIKFYF